MSNWSSQDARHARPVRHPRSALRERLAKPEASERIFDGFLAACARQPKARAVVFQNRVWTYEQLEKMSHAIAIQVVQHTEPLQVVALFGRRGPELVASMLACLRAGRTFAVMDAAYPQDRLAQLIQICRPSMVIAASRNDEDSALFARIQAPSVTYVDECTDLGNDVQRKSLDKVVPSHNAYLLFTSGTTGTPKCIQTPHEPLVHFVRWYAERFDVTPASRVSMLSGLGHDPVLRDIFVPLSMGAELHIPQQEHVRDPAKLFGWLFQAQISHTHVTPQLSQIIAAGQSPGVLLERLRFVFSGGDTLRKNTVTNVLALAPHAQVVNFYGATETPQAMAYHVYDPATDATLDVMPIGRGISDVHLSIVNSDMTAANPGAVGQIAIRTQYLSNGYLGDPALTRQKFVQNPTSADARDVLYLTGDVGRMREDGAMIVQGRADDQVKVRGFRVELGEVGQHLERLPQVAAAVVLAEAGHDGENRLIAYLVGRTGVAGDAQDTTAVKAGLGATLPSYMVPFQCFWLERLPLLPNGKLDRKALVAHKASHAAPVRTQEVNPKEETIIEQWKTLLGLDAISVNASFVELGGDSLSFIRASMQLTSVLGEVPDRWDLLPIRELAKQASTETRKIVRMDTSVLMRALSIIAVVAGHLGLPNIAGSVLALFFVSGLSFGKYSASSALRTGRVTSILQLAFKIALPTVLFTELLDLVFFHFQWQALFLLNNFIKTDFVDGGYKFWFICVLVQSQLILAGVLSFDRVRETIRRHPFAVPMSAALLATPVTLIVPRLWDTSALYHQVPHMYLGFMLLGWAAMQASTLRQRLLVLVGMAGLLIFPSLRTHTWPIFPMMATAVLLFRPRVVLPVAVASVVNWVAGASLYIYLTDYQVANVMAKTPLGGNLTVVLGVCLVVGVAVNKGWEASTEVAGRVFRDISARVKKLFSGANSATSNVLH